MIDRRANRAGRPASIREPAADQAAGALRAKGLSYRQIGDRLGLAPPAARRAVLRAAVQKCTSSASTSPEQESAALGSESHPARPAGEELYLAVRAAFVLRGTSVAAVARRLGIHKQHAREALLGLRRGPRASEIRRLLSTAAGIQNQEDAA